MEAAAVLISMVGRQRILGATSHFPWRFSPLGASVLVQAWQHLCVLSHAAICHAAFEEALHLDWLELRRYFQPLEVGGWDDLHHS